MLVICARRRVDDKAAAIARAVHKKHDLGHGLGHVITAESSTVSCGPAPKTIKLSSIRASGQAEILREHAESNFLARLHFVTFDAEIRNEVPARDACVAREFSFRSFARVGAGNACVHGYCFGDIWYEPTTRLRRLGPASSAGCRGCGTWASC